MSHIVDSTSLRYSPVLFIQFPQSAQSVDIALGEIAWAAQQNPVGDVVDAAVGTRRVVVEFKIARVVESPIAALAPHAVLVQQMLVHLLPTHLLVFGLLDTYLDPKERCRRVPVVCALGRFGRVVDFAV